MRFVHGWLQMQKKTVNTVFFYYYITSLKLRQLRFFCNMSAVSYVYRLRKASARIRKSSWVVCSEARRFYSLPASERRNRAARLKALLILRQLAKCPRSCWVRPIWRNHTYESEYFMKVTPSLTFRNFATHVQWFQTSLQMQVMKDGDHGLFYMYYRMSSSTSDALHSSWREANEGVAL